MLIPPRKEARIEEWSLWARRFFVSVLERVDAGHRGGRRLFASPRGRQACKKKCRRLCYARALELGFACRHPASLKVAEGTAILPDCQARSPWWLLTVDLPKAGLDAPLRGCLNIPLPGLLPRWRRRRPLIHRASWAGDCRDGFASCRWSGLDTGSRPLCSEANADRAPPKQRPIARPSFTSLGARLDSRRTGATG